MVRWIRYGPTKRLTSNNPVVCSRFYASKYYGAVMVERRAWERVRERESAWERQRKRKEKRATEWDQSIGLIDEQLSITSMRLAFSLDHIFKELFICFRFPLSFSHLPFGCCRRYRILMIWCAVFFVETTQHKLAPYKYVMIIECCSTFL